MAEGRARDEWVRMSSLMALIANAHRDPKKRCSFKPRDFDPFARRSRPVKVGIGVLKNVYLRGRMPREVLV